VFSYGSLATKITGFPEEKKNKKDKTETETKNNNNSNGGSSMICKVK